MVNYYPVPSYAPDVYFGRETNGRFWATYDGNEISKDHWMVVHGRLMKHIFDIQHLVPAGLKVGGFSRGSKFLLRSVFLPSGPVRDKAEKEKYAASLGVDMAEGI